MRRVPMALFFIVGLFLRLRGIDRPFWIDEASYMNWIKSGRAQEFVTVGIGWVSCALGLNSEVWIRMPFVLAGALTIPVVYWVIQDKRYALAAAAFVAFCPLFYFWSGFARPYAFAGLFVVLGFRLWWCYPIALLTTPFSIIGLNLFKIKKYWPFYLLFIAVAIILFKIRPDSGRNFLDWRFLSHAKRLWYIPVLSLTVHLGCFLSGKSQRIRTDNLRLARRKGRL